MYSVFVKRRCIKRAFFLNPSQPNWQEWIDAICRYNQEVWGGRYSPIILTDGETLSADWWTFLSQYDPDYIFSITKLSATLEAEIRDRINPIGIETEKRIDDAPIPIYIHPSEEPLQVLPNDISMKRFSKLLSYNVLAAIRSGVSSSEIYRFVLRSFGVFQPIVYMDKALENVSNIEDFHVEENTEVIANILEELCKLAVSKPPVYEQRNFVYPVQFSMLGKPEWWVDYDHKHSSDVFGLIVGDSINEQIFLRNKVFYERDSDHRDLNHIWIPSSWINNERIVRALSSWIRNTSQHLHVFSFSVPREQLENFSEKITNDERTLKPVYLNGITTEFTFPNYYPDWNSDYYHIKRPDHADFHRGYGNKETFRMETPLLDGARKRGNWIGEIYVEADNDRFYSGSGMSALWWQLPKKNQLCSKFFLSEDYRGTVEANVRVNAKRMPCIQFRADNPKLRLKLEDDISVLRHAIVNSYWEKRISEMQNRANKSELEEPNDEVEIASTDLSVAGRYLNGFIKIFGSLYDAHHVLSSRYWRNVFDRLSRRDPQKDENNFKIFDDKVRKRLETAQDLNQLINDSSLSVDLFKELKQIATTKELEIKLESLQNLADEENKDFRSQSDTQGNDKLPALHEALFKLLKEIEPNELSREIKTLLENLGPSELEKELWGLLRRFKSNQLKDDLDEFLERGVFQIGISQKCPLCGLKNWSHIDKIHQSIECVGCRHISSLRSEPTWSYKISTLVEKGMREGLVPVVLVLGELLRESSSSFFFAPCLDLFKSNTERTFAESDIVCISNGKLILGEVKDSEEVFGRGNSRSQIERLTAAARMVNPDKLIFSAMSETPRSSTKSKIEKIAEELKDTQIKVEWFSLPAHIFEPNSMD